METKKQVKYVRTKLEDTNGYKAKHNTFFISCCKLAEIPNTARQFSKYKRGLGLAIKQKAAVLAQIKAAEIETTKAAEAKASTRPTEV